jgi:lipopolysaccharide biosynthesis glycosyltransferase
LLKDPSQGAFETSELQAAWQVEVVAEPQETNGWWTKLHAFFLPGRRRILLLDSDIIFLGPVLEKLAMQEEDIVGHWGRWKPLPEEEKIRYAKDGYFALPALRKAYPDFVAPDYYFNAGQFLLTSGILQHEDFAPLWTEGEPKALRYPHIFTCYDQGLLNFLLAEKKRQQLCTVGFCDFVKWRQSKHLQDLSLESIRRKEGYPFLFHSAGDKPYFLAGYPRGDLLWFYEKYYYSRIEGGAGRRLIRLWQRHQEAQSERKWRIWKMQGKRVSFLKLLRAESNPGPLGDPEAFLVSI